MLPGPGAVVEDSLLFVLDHRWTLPATAVPDTGGGPPYRGLVRPIERRKKPRPKSGAPGPIGCGGNAVPGNL